jgi:cytochrome c oxidase assembly factor CtaG
VPAFIILNVAMIAIHWPTVVELMLKSDLAHFSVHAGLFLSALVAWMPVRSPTPALPRMRPPQQMLYLLFHSILPTIPASFLTFSSVALYPVYGDAALEWGLTAVADQTIAGVIMKLAGGILLWTAIAIIWFRWVGEERRWDELEAELRSTQSV